MLTFPEEDFFVHTKKKKNHARLILLPSTKEVVVPKACLTTTENPNYNYAHQVSLTPFFQKNDGVR